MKKTGKNQQSVNIRLTDAGTQISALRRKAKKLMADDRAPRGGLVLVGGGLGGAIATILPWISKQFFQIEMPPDVAAAFAVILIATGGGVGNIMAGKAKVPTPAWIGVRSWAALATSILALVACLVGLLNGR